MEKHNLPTRLCRSPSFKISAVHRRHILVLHHGRHENIYPSPNSYNCPRKPLVFATPKQLPVLDSAYIYFYLDSPSANGLICLSSLNMGEGYVARRTLYIYYPIIKEYAILPSPTNCSTKDFEEYAFGFCPKTSQYKLLRVVTTYTSKQEQSNRCEIYTLGTPAWREVSNYDFADELCDSICFGINCVFNGAIHIWAQRILHKDYVMLCFDLEIEEFVPFPQPHFATNRHLKYLGVLDNCLIVTCSTEDMNSAGILEVWMMQEYMREDSWTKKCEIDYSAQADWDRFDKHEYCYQHLKPIQVLSDGGLVVSYDGNIYFYDPQKRRLTKSVISDTSWLLHTPTFVSPKKLMGIYYEMTIRVRRILPRLY